MDPAFKIVCCNINVLLVGPKLMIIDGPSLLPGVAFYYQQKLLRSTAKKCIFFIEISDINLGNPFF